MALDYKRSHAADAPWLKAKTKLAQQPNVQTKKKLPRTCPSRNARNSRVHVRVNPGSIESNPGHVC